MDKQVTDANVETSESSVELGQQLSQSLAAARQQKKWSLEDVVERLKISQKHLSYFESDALDMAQLDPFQRGYLRNYAELLDVDIEPFEQVFPVGGAVSSDLQSVEQSDSHVEPVISTKLLKFLISIFIIALIVVLLMINL